MHELIKRLKASPLITFELLGASFFANILALASSLFVMQVLNRYVAHGVTSSLVTMVGGVMVAIAFEVAFRQIRLKLADAVSKPFDRAYALAAYDILTCARGDALAQLTPGQKREAAGAPDAVQQAYSAPNITAYLDLPFAGVFLFALLMLKPILALVTVVFAVIVIGVAVLNYKAMQEPMKGMQLKMADRQGLLDSALSDPDTVRVFTAQNYLRKRWASVQSKLEGARTTLSIRQGGQQNYIGGIQALLSTAIIGIGAALVVNGMLDVGLLIGANILASRTLGPIIRVTQSAGTIVKANGAMKIIEQFSRMPLETNEGTALGDYKGGIEFKDVGFAYTNQPTPLFETVNVKINPGSLFVISGANGTGKTTMARLITGVIRPLRGQIFIDGVDLVQVSPEWWRRQLIYLPQEPSFINATVRENILAFNPKLSDKGLNAVIRDAGLEGFFAKSQQGFDMRLNAGGRDLSLGIRRRLALARALATGGMLVVMDEPTEGMDVEGSQQIAKVMNTLNKRGCTIIALSHDPNIIKGAPFVLDLNAKPTPKILNRQAQSDQILGPNAHGETT